MYYGERACADKVKKVKELIKKMQTLTFELMSIVFFS
jgi:hypothetical protein